MMKKLHFVFLAVFLIGFFCSLNIALLHQLMPHIGPYDSRRILVLILLGIIAIYFAIFHEARDRALALFQSFPKSIIITLGIFFFLGIISSATAAISHKMAFLQVGNYFLLFMAMLLVAGLRMDYGEKFDRLMIFLLIAMMGVLCLQSLINYGRLVYTTHIIKAHYAAQASILLPRVHHFYWQKFTTPSFQNIRFLSQFLTWTLPLYTTSMCLRFKFSKWLKPLFFVIISYMWLLVWLNDSRAVFLSLIVVLVLSLVLWHKKVKTYLLWQLATIVGAFVFWFLLIHLGLHQKALATHLTDMSAPARYALWMTCLNLMWHFPLLGTGPMQISYYSAFIGHPHSALLQTGAQWGIPAMLCVAYIVISGFFKLLLATRKLADKYNNASAVIIIAVTLGVTMGLIDSFFSGTIVMPLSQITGAVLIGWALGIYWQSQRLKIEEKLALSTRHYHGFLLIFVLIAVVMVAYGVFPTILNTTAYTKLYITEVCQPLKMMPCMINPAFWAQGLIWVKPGLVLHVPHAAAAAHHVMSSGAAAS